MDERDFWVALEFRVCGEFAGLPERRYQYFWCDGFIPNEYILNDHSPRITGTCWICNGAQQDEWEFIFLLPKPYRSQQEIDWASLLPAENTTRWMGFDEERKLVEIEPAVAVPDLAKNSK